MLPAELKVFPLRDFFLLLEAKRKKLSDYENIVRYQTILLAEAFIGKGNGISFVKNSWKKEEDSVELTTEQVKELHIWRRQIEEQRKQGKLKLKKVG